MMSTAPNSRTDNIEACEMIEALLYELVPYLDEEEARRTARQLVCLRAFQSLDRKTGKECLKSRLKTVSRKLLDVANKRRRANTMAITPTNKVAKEQVPPSKQVFTKVPFEDCQDKADRHHILINTVGGAKYDAIVSVTREIEEIRRVSAVWTKFSSQRQQWQRSRRPEEEEEDDREEEAALPASEALPTPIADVYFRTRLVDVMRHVNSRTCIPNDELKLPAGSGDECCIVRRSDWDSLLEDAERKLTAFRAFEADNVEKGENLSFSCGFGICSKSKCCA